MTTIINTPGNSDGGDSGSGMIIGVVVLLAAIVLTYLYILPAMRNPTPGKDINIDVKIPAELPAKNPSPVPTSMPVTKPNPSPVITP